MKSFILGLFLVSLGQAFAATDAEINDPYFRIDEIRVFEIPCTPSDDITPSDKGLSDVIIALDKIVAIGQKIWKIIEDGKAISKVDMNASVSVLPRIQGAVVSADELENWSLPLSKTYKVQYINGFGNKVISFEYTIDGQVGGSYEGVGLYLNGVGVRAKNVEVDWGFEFNAVSKVVAISNIGSKANPVAGVSLELFYEAKSPLGIIKSTDKLFLSGKGEFVRQ